MELKASEVQKQRIQEIEAEADALVRSCSIMFVSSVNEKGYPRTCIYIERKVRSVWIIIRCCSSENPFICSEMPV